MPRCAGSRGNKRNSPSPVMARVAGSEKALTEAKVEEAKMVLQCRCKAKQLLDKTLNEMNASAQAANTKAWKMAAHMMCVLDGKSEGSCSVPALPVVKPVKLSDQVLKGCLNTKTMTKTKPIKTWSDPNYRTGGKVQSGGKFTLYQLPKADFTSDDSDKYAKMCTDAGLLPTGCGSWDMWVPYDCASYFKGGGKCISMPASWNCHVRIEASANMQDGPVYLPYTIPAGKATIAMYSYSKKTGMALVPKNARQTHTGVMGARNLKTGE